MKVEIIEVILVLIIVTIQIGIFYKTYIQIGIFKSIIPKISNLKITKIFVPIHDLQSLEPKIILSKVIEYKNSNKIPNVKKNIDNVIIKNEFKDDNSFYLSSPNSDGSFNENPTSLNYKDGTSIYKFTKTFNNKAVFQIYDSQTSIRLALTFPDKCIYPVCDSLNAYNLNAIEIETIQLGEAELIEDKWIVTKKAHISYNEIKSNKLDESIKVSIKKEIIYTEKAEVNIVECDGKINFILESILFSINNYLIRNRGAATDFNLIKDIVERNTNAIEEDINISIGIPLYLGLAGTMLGIVIGLFNMPDLGIDLDTKSKDLMLNDGISLLIGGVKIAMIASFSGLTLTIINSGWIFKGSRSLIESRKNEFYTFIQIELLPIINQGLASTLESLQRNLMNFNDKFTFQLNAFSNTVSNLSGIFETSKEAIVAQKELLEVIDKAKVSQMTTYNVKVLQQLDISVKQFEKFNNYLTNVNVFVDNTQLIVSKTNELLERTNNFKVIADNLDNKLNQSQQLLEFLSAHFNKLEEHKEYTSNAVADVGHAISSSFSDLREQTQKLTENFKNFTVDEINALKQALAESKTNLSNLEYLATINKDVSLFKNSSASQGERLKQQVDDLNKNMARSIIILEEIESNSLTTSIKQLFKSKKNK